MMGKSSKNAYVLVYEKVQKDPVQFKLQNESEETEIMKSLNLKQEDWTEKCEENSEKIEEEIVEEKEEQENKPYKNINVIYNKFQ